MPKQNITFALFDVRPIDPQSGRVNFELIESLSPTVNLAPFKKSKKFILKESSEYSILPVKSVSESGEGKQKILQELEASLSGEANINKELELFGGKLVEKQIDFDYIAKDNENLEKFRKEFSKMISGYTSETAKSGEAKLLAPPLYLPWAPHLTASEGWGPEVTKKRGQKVIISSPAAREVESILADFKRTQAKTIYPEISLLPQKALEDKTNKPLIYFAFGITAAFLLAFISFKSLNLKNNILQRSNQAYINLNSVQENLNELNFSEAASSFALAAENFELILSDLKKVSAAFSILDKVTLGGVSQAASLIEAGELIAEAGLDLNAALKKISGVNLISIIQKDETAPVVEQSLLGGAANILEVLGQFRLHLIQASRNLNQAQSLISGYDSSLIPESERKKFDEFKAELPELNSFIERAVSYSDALMVMLGQSGNQKYLLLFQNSSELRPTGGFAGSYALVEFDKGVMKKFFVDDIYNPDGQMKEKIIPPRPLQKITPNWGMRDANWFADFPASAKKVAEFYYKDTNTLVDGVMAVNVDLIPEILKITGPIEMPDFEIILNSENFLAKVQEEIEYVRTKGEAQPKRILVEFAPKLLEKLSALSQEGWMKVFALLVDGVEQKIIQAYFADGRLQKFVFENNFAGEIKEADGDFLMVVHSNIMGSKTDAVIDNYSSLTIENSAEGLIHALEITRTHKGGSPGFYNKRNNDYVRVLLPAKAELVEVSGNDEFELDLSINYRQEGFVSDPDLERYESRIKKVGNVDVFEESGKKVFAFWMIIEPGQTKTVKVKYKVPSSPSSIYIQKQSGLKSEFKLIFNNKVLFDENLSSDKNITLE